MRLARLGPPGYHDAAWKTRRVLPPPGGALSGRRIAPIRVTETRKPCGTSPKPGVYVFDFGQNLVGWCRLQVNGPAGHAVQLRHAEMLSPTARSTRPTSAAPHRTDHYTSRAMARGLRAAVHLPRLPLRRGERLSRRAGWPPLRPRGPRRSGAGRRFRLLQRPAQSASTTTAAGASAATTAASPPTARSATSG